MGKQPTTIKIVAGALHILAIISLNKATTIIAHKFDIILLRS